MSTIGNFDTTNVVWASLPSCLKNGTNPQSYDQFLSYFPVYNGPATNIKIQGVAPLFNSHHPNESQTSYQNGKIRTTSGDNSYGLIPKGYQFKLNQIDDWTIHTKWDMDNPAQFGMPGFAAFFNGQNVTYPQNNDDYNYRGFQWALISDYPSAGMQSVYINFANYAGDVWWYKTWVLDNILSGIQNITLTKVGNVIDMYQNGHLLSVIEGGGSSIDVTLDTFLTSGMNFPSDTNVWDVLFTSGNYKLNYGSIYNPNAFLNFPTPNGLQSGITNWNLQYIVYNKALTLSEIQQVISLGSDLGLYGYNNNDGTLELVSSKKQYYIGLFETTNVVVACLPSCLKNGTNPLSHQIINHPLFTGPSLPNKIQGYSPRYTGPIYGDGKIKPQSVAERTYGIVSKNFQFELNNFDSWTMYQNININTSGTIPIVLNYSNGKPSITLYIFCEDGSLYPALVGHYIVELTINGTNYSPFYYIDYLISDGVFPSNINLTLTKNISTFNIYLNGILQTNVINSNGNFSTILSANYKFPDTLTFYNILENSSTDLTQTLLLPFPGIKYEIGSISGYPESSTNFILFNKALSASEINNLIALGPDLGGLKGYDNKDGTMTLQTTEKRTFVGNFETTNVVLAALPSCWKNFSNPEDHYIKRYNFPLYNGPAVINNIQGYSPVDLSFPNLNLGSIYSNGKLLSSLSSTVHSHNPITKNFQFPLNDYDSWTIHQTINITNNDFTKIGFCTFFCNINDTTLPGFAINIFKFSPDIMSPFEYFVEILLNNADFSKYWFADMYWSNSATLQEGIHNITVTKSIIDFKIYMDGNLITSAFDNINPENIPIILSADKLIPDIHKYSSLDTLGELEILNLITLPSSDIIIGNPSFNNTPDSYQGIIFNKALSQQEITNLIALGPDLGGTYGTDNGDGTMNLLKGQSKKVTMNILTGN